jgi:DNA uptake protein ComE-like DNA-binding protein
MPTIHYWPQKNQPQPLSYLHRLSLDGVALQQGPNEVSPQEHAKVLAHPNLGHLVACGAIDVDSAIAGTTATPSTEPDALRLINSVALASELEILPTIGRGAATIILENRPAGGYVDLEHVWVVNPRILKKPYTTDVSLVAQWGGDGS